MAILDGQFKPGEWLRQQRIAQEFGVSQMPVREALRKLAAEGVVEHVPYRGARVVEFSPQDIADLYAHRSYLESKAAKIAAESISPGELAELRDLQTQMQQDSHRHSEGVYRKLNHRFHQIVYSASPPRLFDARLGPGLVCFSHLDIEQPRPDGRAVSR